MSELDKFIQGLRADLEPNIVRQLNEDYDLSRAYINRQYDNYPTRLVDLPISPEALSEMTNAESAARYLESAGVITPKRGLVRRLVRYSRGRRYQDVLSGDLSDD